MAAPDLTSQKLMGTNPDQGYGDSVVLPYRPRGFDYNPYNFMGANEDRAAKERVAKAARDLDLISKFGKVSDDTKGNPELQNLQAKMTTELGAMLDRGETPSHQLLADWQGRLTTQSAFQKEEKNKADEDLTKTIPGYADYYGDAYNKGLALKDSTESYRFTPIGGFKSNADPTQATHLYDLPVAAQEFAKNFSNIHASSQSSESSQEDPEKATSYSNSIGSVFMVADPNNPKKLIPGVGQKHIDEFLNEKNGVAAKKIDKEVVLPEYQADAKRISELAKTDKSYSKYAMMTPEQITQDLLTNGNPLRKSSNGPALNQAGYRNQVAKQQLEAYNNEVRKTVFSNEEKSSIDNSTGGSTTTGVIATPGDYSHTTTAAAPTYHTDPTTGKVTRTTYNINPGNIPGVFFSVKKGENGPATPGLPPLTANVKNIRNLTTGQILQKTITDPTLQITHAGFGLIDPQGRKIGGPVDATSKRLNDLANQWKQYYANGMKGTKPESFGNFTGQDIATGFVNEKVNVENDEAAQKKAKDSGGEYLYSEDENGKKIATIRYAVQTPFTRQDAVGSHVRANTNYYNRSKLSPDEQELRDAWNQYNAAISGY